MLPLRQSQGAGDVASLIVAHQSLGTSLLFLGEFTRAYSHLEQGLALYESQAYHTHAFRYGTDLNAISQSHASWALWFLGYPDQALKRSQGAMTQARELSHPTLPPAR